MPGRRDIRAHKHIYLAHINTYPRREAPEAGQAEHPQVD